MPQEEVPLYESKGKQFMKKPALPVGMCPIVAQEAKSKREKQQQKQEQTTKKINSIPGLIQLSSSSSCATPTQKPKQSSGKCKNATEIASKSNQKATSSGATTTTKTASTTSTKSKNISNKCSDDSVTDISNTISDLNLNIEDELAKKLKKLRKKIREIEAIESKLATGELKNPEQDQLDKIGRKKTILKHLRELEKEIEEQ